MSRETKCTWNNTSGITLLLQLLLLLTTLSSPSYIYVHGFALGPSRTLQKMSRHSYSQSHPRTGGSFIVRSASSSACSGSGSASNNRRRSTGGSRRLCPAHGSMLRVSSWTSALSTVKQDTIPHEDIDTVDVVDTRTDSDNQNTEGGGEDEDKEKDVNNKNVAEMVCKIVASADGKIQRISRRQSDQNVDGGKSVEEANVNNGDANVLMDKIDSIYQAENHKYLKTLPYMNMNSVSKPQVRAESDDGDDDENESDIEEDEKEEEERRASYDPKAEECLISTLKTSLENSGFKLLSQRDLDLCNALNDGYLLRLSIEPDVKGFDPVIGREFYGERGRGREGEMERYGEGGTDVKMEESSNGNADADADATPIPVTDEVQQLLLEGRILIFRRGYSSEITRGRLIPPKLDYLQSSIVQRSAARLARRIARVDQYIDDRLTSTVQYVNGGIRDALDSFQIKTMSSSKGGSEQSKSSSQPPPPAVARGEKDNDVKDYEELGELERRKALVNDAIAEKLQPLADKGVDILKDATDAALNSTTTALVENIKENANNRKNKIMLGRYAGRTTAKSTEDINIDSSNAVGANQSADKSKEAALTFAGVAASASTASMDIDDALAPFLVCEVGNGNDDASLDTSCKYDITHDAKKANGNVSNSQSQGSSDPTVNLLERVSIANLVDLFSTGGRRRLIKSMFSVSELVEPTYEEVVLVWRRLPDESKKKKKKKKPVIPIPKWIYDTAEIFDIEDRLPEKPKPPPSPVPLPLEIRTFDRVPMANLLAVLPKTKLIFRPADALIFDLVNAFSLLAVLASQKFDSPKLDIIALVSVCLWLLRTFFRYSNKLARYDLLVNKFLTSRISHRDAGALRYIASEAGIQRSKRASLVHEWLVMDYYSTVMSDRGGDNDGINAQQPTRDEILQIGLMEVNKLLDAAQPVSIDINAALDDLVGLDLIQFDSDGQLVRILTGKQADQALSTLWNDIFDK